MSENDEIVEAGMAAYRAAPDIGDNKLRAFFVEVQDRLLAAANARIAALEEGLRPFKCVCGSVCWDHLQRGYCPKFRAARLLASPDQPQPARPT